MAIVGANASQKDIGVGNRTVPTLPRRTAARKIATPTVQVRSHVFPAALAGGRVKDDQLVAVTSHARVSQAGRQHRRNPVRKRRHAVHEDPKARHAVRRGQHAAKQQAHHKEHVGNVAAPLGRVHDGDAGMRKRAREDEELPKEQPHERAALGRLVRGAGIVVEPDGVVDAHKHDDRHERVPRNLDEHLRQHKDLPAVCLGGPLAHLVQGALRDKVRHLLLHQLAKDAEDVENGKHLILEALDAERRVEEHEPDEEGDRGAQDELGVNVRRRAPVLLKDAPRHDEQLAPKGGGEFPIQRATLPFRHGIVRGGGCLQPLQLRLDVVELLARPPRLVPVDLGGGTRRRANDLQHPFGGIVAAGARMRAVSLKVGYHGGGAVANVAKVDCAAALGQKQQPVEALKEHRRRLVDGAEDGLPCPGELFQKIKNRPRCLRVESRCRLVDE